MLGILGRACVLCLGWVTILCRCPSYFLMGRISLQTAPPSLPRGVALTALVPLPALKTTCGMGCGLAACPALGLLVTSDYINNTLSVWGLPGDASGGDGGSMMDEIPSIPGMPDMPFAKQK